MRPAADGVLVVDKPVGPTSHDVVQVARRTFGPRVGHTGTLDPLASGVLPLVVGAATRLAQFMTAASKAYDATIVFGRATDTYDAAGRTTTDTGRHPSPADLTAAVATLPGRFAQTPPAYSAKKIAGEAAHRLARRATPVLPAPVEVEIHDAELLEIDGPTVRLRIHVSAGFYVRSLAHDLGVRFGVGAHLGGLRRTSSGPFGLDAAITWERVATGGDGLRTAVVPMDRLLPHLSAARLADDAVARVRHGQRIAATIDVPAEAERTATPGPVRLLDTSGRLVGLARPVGDDGGSAAVLLQPIVVFG